MTNDKFVDLPAAREEWKMSADRHEGEHYLTPAGWVNGSQKVYDNETKTVARPVDAVLRVHAR